MPAIAELLSPTSQQALVGVKVVIEPRAKGEPKTKRTKGGRPIRSCMCPKRNDGFRRDGNDMVHRGCGYPRKQESMLIGATAQSTTSACSNCSEPVSVVTRKDDHTASVMGERSIICRDCAGKGNAALPLPIGFPTAAVQTTNTQEKSMPVSISSLTPVALGTAVADAERDRLAADMPAKQKKALKKRAKAEKQAKAEVREQRVALTSLETLPGFSHNGVEVPDLEVSAIPSLDEVPARGFRSPYNKLRARAGEDLHLAKDNPEDDGKACTWQDLINDHQRFALAAKQATHVDLLTGKDESEPKPTKAKKAKKAQISAPVDLDEKARIKALRTALGCTKAEAKQILATV